MKTLKHLSLISIALLALSTASAKHENCQSKPKYSPTPCLCDIPPETSAYNQSAKVNICEAKGISVTGNFIYWEPTEQGLYSAGFGPTASTEETKLIDMSFEFEPGFKVALGSNFNHDDWKITLEYIRFHPTNNKTVVRPAWATTTSYLWNHSSAGNADEIKIKLKIAYDMADLELSRAEYRGKKLIFNPFAGLRGGRLDQSFSVTAIIPTDQNTNNVAKAKSDSWLLGLRAGISSKWIFGKGFSLFGKLATSLLYQDFSNLKYTAQNTDNGELSSNVKADDTNSINPTLDLLLGFKWESHFDNNHWHFDFFTGYEIQHLWNQNMMMVTREYQLLTNSSPGDLTFHGLTVTAKFDF